jgi:5-(carboxyamino)imidazole ribonucleotide synthase
MENLIGEDVARAQTLAGERGVQVHLYGKAETRPGRKMGHVNRVTGAA